MGASHVRSGTPNQDSAQAWSTAPSRGAAVVADGHGSKSYFRSHTGSKLAVQVASLFYGRCCEEVEKLGTAAELKALLTGMASEWGRLVDEDRHANPITELEREFVATKALPESVWDKSVPETLSRSVYGSTLVGVFAIDAMLLCFQLGDGDIVLIDRQGELQHVDLKPVGMLGTETTSLSMSTAEQLFKTCVLAAEDIGLIFVSTDGYANSYASDEDFLAVPRDLFGLLSQGKLDEVNGGLTEWMTDTTTQGSGDDISIAMLWNPSTPAPLREDDAFEIDAAVASVAIDPISILTTPDALLIPEAESPDV